MAQADEETSIQDTTVSVNNAENVQTVEEDIATLPSPSENAHVDNTTKQDNEPFAEIVDDPSVATAAATETVHQDDLQASAEVPTLDVDMHANDTNLTTASNGNDSYALAADIATANANDPSTIDVQTIGDGYDHVDPAVASAQETNGHVASQESASNDVNHAFPGLNTSVDNTNTNANADTNTDQPSTIANEAAAEGGSSDVIIAATISTPAEQNTAPIVAPAIDSDIEEGEEVGDIPPPSPEGAGGSSPNGYKYGAIPGRDAFPLPASPSRRSRSGRSRSPIRRRSPSMSHASATGSRLPSPPAVKKVYNRSELFKVYIGGLPEATQRVDLEDCFSQFGEIGHIELKLGYAFLEFVTEEGAKGAIDTYNEGHFLGKMIKVEASRSATTQQESIDKGTCFTCGEHGHFAKYCPQDPRNAGKIFRDTGRRPPRERSPLPPRDRDRERERREWRENRDRGDRPSIRDRDRDRDRFRGDRDDARRRFPPRDRDTTNLRARDRDADKTTRGGARDDSRRPLNPNDPAVMSERDLLDRERDRERQMRRLLELDPNFAAAAAAAGGNLPPGFALPGPGGPYPPGAIPVPHPYPPYGMSAPIHGASPGMPPYGSLPGPSGSPPLSAPGYRDDPRGQRPPSAGSPYNPQIPPYGGRPDGGSNGRDQPYRQDNNAGSRRDSQSDRYGEYRQPSFEVPPRGESAYPRDGGDRRDSNSSRPPGANGQPSPYYQERGAPAWSAPGPVGSPAFPPGAGPPLDSYGRPMPPYQAGGPPREQPYRQGNEGAFDPYTNPRYDRR